MRSLWDGWFAALKKPPIAHIVSANKHEAAGIALPRQPIIQDQSMSKNLSETSHKTEAEQLTELELTLTVLWNSVRRWMSQRSNSSEVNGLSELDVFLLHLLVYRNRQLRAVDLAFALSVDDMHLVTYSLKKLARLGMVDSTKIGKEAFYEATEKGREHYEDFHDDRRTFLEPAMDFLPQQGIDIGKVNQFLRALSGMYEQAARAAASSRG